MTAYMWAAFGQWAFVFAAIAWAWLSSEPKYVEVMQSGGWTEAKSRQSASNRSIYTRRLLRTGSLVGLTLGLIAAFITWMVG